MSEPSDLPAAKRQIEALVSALRVIVESDPGHDVRGIALPVLHAAVPFANPHRQVPGGMAIDRVTQAVNTVLYGAEHDGWSGGPWSKDPIRASDALIVASVLAATLVE